MSDGLVDWLRECLEPLGTVAARKMFGGAGLYLDGAIVAILADDEVWFKSGAEADAAYDAAGMERFRYDFGEKQGTMNYRRAPGDVYDDADAMRRWAAIAIAVSRRAAVRKR
jgi:DNA transformation protein